MIDKSFGFDTAVEQAVRVVNSATVEASSHQRGVGIVKLMGRHAGYIAMTACLAARQANACLIPEVIQATIAARALAPAFRTHAWWAVVDCMHQMDFRCDALCQYISDKLDATEQFVLVVAEGTQVCDADRRVVTTGAQENKVDESGNKKMEDVGLLLDKYIRQWFAKRGRDINVKVWYCVCCRGVGGGAAYNASCRCSTWTPHTSSAACLRIRATPYCVRSSRTTQSTA